MTTPSPGVSMWLGSGSGMSTSSTPSGPESSFTWRARTARDSISLEVGSAEPAGHARGGSLLLPAQVAEDPDEDAGEGEHAPERALSELGRDRRRARVRHG